MSDSRDVTPAMQALRDLRGAAPPPERLRRITDGAWTRIEDRARHRSWSPLWSIGAAAAAAIAVVVIVFAPQIQPAQPVAHGELIADDEPITPDAPPAESAVAVADPLILGPHRVIRAADAEIAVISDAAPEWRLRLDDGEASFDIEPLASDQRFVVETAHLRVTVVGTRFAIAVEDDCTRVDVAEGRVRVESVDGETLLGPGDGRRACGVRPDELTDSDSDPVPVAGEADVRTAVALIGERRELDRAVGLLESYVGAHPDGVFSEDALFYLAVVSRERARPDDARRWTARFIERFPEGRRADRLRRELERE